jgi:hypothetical protein
MTYIHQQYAGSEWIKKNVTTDTSELGRDVADFLGDLFKGIYHLNLTSLRKVAWNNPYFIRVTINQGLATYDFDELTRIVVLSHDRKIRVSVEPLARSYLSLLFHKRITREGSIMERMPFLDDHVAQIREEYLIKEKVTA